MQKSNAYRRPGPGGMMQPVGLVLAGGAGRRMGGDKALMPLGGRALLAHVIDRLEPQVAGLAISANGDPARLARFGLPVLGDALADQGPLAGVLAGLDWAAGQGADTLVTAPVDAPFLPPDLVPRLLLAGEGMAQPLVIATGPDAGPDDGPHGDGDGGAGGVPPGGGAIRPHPTFALWPVGLRDDLRAALRQGTRRLGACAIELGARTAFFADGAVCFHNLNTPADLDRAALILAASGR